MGLFGDIDANDVADDPFFVPAGTYEAVLTDATLYTPEGEETPTAIFFTWTIEDDEAEEYDGNSVSDRCAVFPEITADEITPKIRKAFSFTKARLSQMGLDENQMNGLLDEGNETLSDLVGLEATLQVRNSTDKNDADKKYSNVAKVVVK